MAARRSPTADDFDGHLRLVLGARADAAPMPAGVLDIPSGWTRPPRRAVRVGVRTLTAAAAATALVAAMAVAIPHLRSVFPPDVDPTTAAALVGVPAAQVVETRDGAVAFEIVAVPEPRLNVYVVTRADARLTAELLVTLAVPVQLLDDGSSTVWMDSVSCSPRRGLEHPNIIVGGSNPPPTFVDVSAASETAAHDAFFIVVLDSEDLEGVGVGVDLGTARANTGAAAFDRADACLGEEITP